jgi:hypothetical protein
VEFAINLRHTKSVTISPTPVGVGAVSQRLIPTGERSGIADAHRDRKRFIVHADEKLTAFLELETAIRTAETCENPASRA